MALAVMHTLIFPFFMHSSFQNWLCLVIQYFVNKVPVPTAAHHVTLDHTRFLLSTITSAKRDFSTRGVGGNMTEGLAQQVGRLGSHPDGNCRSNFMQKKICA